VVSFSALTLLVRSYDL